MMLLEGLPRIGLGCAPLGNLHRVRTDEECRAVLEAAWDAGVRHFDTAPHYGLGLSEERLGAFLSTKPRDEFIVSTKVGRLLRPNPSWDRGARDDGGFDVPASSVRVWDFTPEGIRTSLEESLQRLCLEQVDVVYLHDPEHSGIDGAIEDGMSALAGLREDGRVAAIGIGSMTASAVLAAVDTGLADLVMVAGRYTLLDQSVHPQVLAACSEHDTGIVAAAVFNSGLLAGPPSREATFDYGSVPDDVLGRARAIDAVCAEHGVELATAAMNYPLLDPRVRAVVVGADTPTQVQQNLAHMTVEVPDALWDELADRDLVPRCA